MSCLQHLRFALIGLACWGGIFCSSVYSQTRRGEERQYRPARETVSPYIGLLQGNAGAAPNFYTLVRPRLDQRAFNQQLQATSRIQSLDIQRITGSAESSPRAVLTGKNAGFEQYLHYYPTLPVTVRGR